MKSFIEALSDNLALRNKIAVSLVRKGDLLDINPYWNATSGSGLKIKSPTEILDVDKSSKGCQTGVMFKVRCANGDHRWLDAGWFF